MGTKRTAQAAGYGPLGNSDGTSDWISVKKTALEDAARRAIRAVLQGTERNRPREARGFIGLSAFPRFYLDGGGWAVSARFLVDITAIQPFPAF
jgi:hypothetical protein